MVTPSLLLSPNDPNARFVIPNHWFVSNISDSISRCRLRTSIDVDMSTISDDIEGGERPQKRGRTPPDPVNAIWYKQGAERTLLSPARSPFPSVSIPTWQGSDHVADFIRSQASWLGRLCRMSSSTSSASCAQCPVASWIQNVDSERGFRTTAFQTPRARQRTRPTRCASRPCFSSA